MSMLTLPFKLIKNFTAIKCALAFESIPCSYVFGGFLYVCATQIKILQQIKYKMKNIF
jgi:hypothetical protein